MSSGSANLDTELLTEHFGYPPVSLLDDIINSINILAERALNSVEKGLLHAGPAALGVRPSTKPPRDGGPTAEERLRHEIENGTHQLETLLCASIDRNFDKFELYVLRNILCVRPDERDWIRLSHYEGLSFAARPADAPTPASVAHLRRRLQASQKLNCMLHAERARNDALLAELRAAVGEAGVAGVADVKMEDGGGGGGGSDKAGAQPSAFGFLRDRGDLTEGDANAPLSTTTAFTLSQLQALRALSQSLRNIVPDLGDGEGGQDGESADAEGRRSWRRERLEYVEGETRKHLENVRGLELGKNGEVRDGEWQGDGRKFANGEVGELETVVGMLGGGNDASDQGDKMDTS